MEKLKHREWLTKREVAEHLRLSVRTVERLIERKELSRTLFGTRVRIHRSDLLDFEYRRRGDDHRRAG